MRGDSDIDEHNSTGEFILTRVRAARASVWTNENAAQKKEQDRTTKNTGKIGNEESLPKKSKQGAHFTTSSCYHSFPALHNNRSLSAFFFFFKLCICKMLKTTLKKIQI
jgi:hypothetical protein